MEQRVAKPPGLLLAPDSLSRLSLLERALVEDMRVLVRTPNWRGDIVMALPVFTALRAHFAGDLGSSDTDHPVAGADAGSLAGR